MDGWVSQWMGGQTDGQMDSFKAVAGGGQMCDPHNGGSICSSASLWPSLSLVCSHAGASWDQLDWRSLSSGISLRWPFRCTSQREVMRHWVNPTSVAVWATGKWGLFPSPEQIDTLEHTKRSSMNAYDMCPITQAGRWSLYRQLADLLWIWAHSVSSKFGIVVLFLIGNAFEKTSRHPPWSFFLVDLCWHRK